MGCLIIEKGKCWIYNLLFPAQKEDGCNVISYTAWSLLDNFEWGSGYSEKFGLHYVDFNDPDRPRSVKESARYFSQLIRDNGFVNGSERIFGGISQVLISTAFVLISFLVKV